jgi:hypothetical protein
MKTYRSIVDVHFHNPPEPTTDQRQLRNFLILAKAFALGIFSTDATLDELLAMASTVSDQTIDDVVVKTVEAEGIYVKYTI